MMRLLATLAFALDLAAAAAVSASAAEPTPPAFTRKPAASKKGGKTVITFAVDRETDVAVYVEDSKGAIVRHLVAGVLGKNPPEPLKANSLEQSVEWDGKDDDGRQILSPSKDKPLPSVASGGGGFKVRVGLGLRASYAGQPFAAKEQSGPNMIENVMGMAAGPDGRLYVLDRCQGWLYWNAARVHVFRRDGSYEKTVKPFPSNTPVEKAKPAGAFVNSFGGFNPLIHRPLGFAFYPAEDVAHQPAVTPDGQLVLAVRTVGFRGGAPQLAMLDRDGGIPGETYAGPTLGQFAGYPYLAAAPDGKAAYLTGLGPGKDKGHAVYRVKLPERDPSEVFFGDPAASGADNAHLNSPRGLAVDGQGHLLVADSGNNRVLVLNERDRSVAGSIPAPGANWVAVGARTGAVYVRGGGSVIKFQGPENPKELARLELPALKDKKATWTLALDGSAEPAILWAASGSRLVRFEDRGKEFADAVPADCFPAGWFWRPAVDPYRREVLCRIGGSWNSQLHILDEASGQMRTVGGGVPGSEGRSHRLGPDGSIYAQDHGFGAGGILRYDRTGKLVPFAATAKDPYLKGRLPFGYTGTTAWERDFSVDRKGDIYVKARGPQYHGLMTVEVFDQEGRHKRTAVHTVTDGMYGPRLDPKGNIYIMEAVKSPGRPYPEEFKAELKGRKDPASWYDWIYGSVIKFGPAGGAVWFNDKRASPVTYEGWGYGKELRTTGGSLTGPVCTLRLPPMGLDAATYNKVTLRLKNDSDGTKATFTWHTRDEGYIESCGPGKSKTVEVKPNSGFTEYTFDMTGEPKWKGGIWSMGLAPSDAKKGTFAIDWVRIGEGESPSTGSGQAPLVWNFNAEESFDKKLPADMKKEPGDGPYRPGNAVVQGALWWKSGFSPVGDMGVGGGDPWCHCTGSDFDVDDFGRTFAPDTGRFRVGVLDTNGNEILSFGAYGNQDNCGPDSYVLDPAGKFLRPRKADDPKELVSPFARPEIGFAWIIGVAATDRYAYVGDVINKRILRVKLDYAATETAAVP